MKSSYHIILYEMTAFTLTVRHIRGVVGSNRFTPANLVGFASLLHNNGSVQIADSFPRNQRRLLCVLLRFDCYCEVLPPSSFTRWFIGLLMLLVFRRFVWRVADRFVE